MDSTERAPLKKRLKARERVDTRNLAKRTVLIEEKIAELGLAQSRRVLQHRAEDRRELARRATDDLQHLRGRGLLLQRFREIVCALAELIE